MDTLEDDPMLNSADSFRLLGELEGRVLYCFFLNASTVFVICEKFVRLLSLESTELSNSTTLTISIDQSPDDGGYLTNIESDCGCVLCSPTFIESSFYSLPSFCVGVLDAKHNATSTRRLGLFKPIRRQSPVKKHNSNSTHVVPPSELPGSQLYSYSLEKTLKVDSSKKLVRIGPLLFTSKVASTESMVVISELVDASSSTRSIIIQLTMATNLESVILPTHVVVPEDNQNFKTLHVATLSTSTPEAVILAVWDPTPRSKLSIFFAVYSATENKLSSSGWHTFVSPIKDGCFHNLEAFQSPDLFTPSFPIPNLTIIWSQGTYTSYTVDWVPVSKTIQVNPFRNFSLGHIVQKPKDLVNPFSIQILPFLAINGFWNRANKSFHLALRNCLQSALFNPTRQGELSSCWMHLPLPEAPHIVKGQMLPRSATILLVSNNKVYIFIFHDLQRNSSSQLLDIKLDTKKETTLGPDEHLFITLGFHNLSVVNAVYTFMTGDSPQRLAELKINKNDVEKTISRLLESGLLEVTPQTVDRLINAGLEECIRRMLISPLTTERIVVELLNREPLLYLADIVHHLSVSHDAFMQEVKAHLEFSHFDCIFQRLTDWCTILTGLPAVLTERQDFPPLEKILDFLGLLIDAKFQELASVPNQSVMENMKTIASNLSDCLMVKKTFQKFLGQLHVLNITKNNFEHIVKDQVSEQLIERVPIHI